jgi:hypothetical protein
MPHAIFFAHTDLFILITAKDPYFRWSRFEQSIDDLVAKGPCPTRNQHPLTRKQFFP